MNVLMISGDSLALNAESGVHKRLLLQASQTDELTVFVPAREAREMPLGSRGIVRGFAGPKRQAARAMRRAARGAAFDIVTAQDPFFLGAIAWRIARRAGAKLELQVHTDVFSTAYLAHNPFRYALAQFLLRRADCIRAVSARIKENIEQSGIRVPISVVPIFIDAEEIAEAPAADLRAAYPHFSKILLVAARLEPEKHIGDIIRAMPAIMHVLPLTGLLIAGDGSARFALQALAEELGIQKSVVWLGHRSDIFSLYKGADLAIAATANYEGYGAATIEALAAGCPVVSRDIGIAREAGARIAPPNGIAEAVIEALNSSARGALALPLPSAEEWAHQWRASLSARVV